MTAAVNERIFRQYDIRGVWGTDLTPDTARLIGRGYGTFVAEMLGNPQPRLSVGRDVRLSSPDIAAGLIEGLSSAGAAVVDIGECPTPVQYFSIHRLDLDGGVMVTGSHNPPEYNGFKLSLGRETISGSGIQRVREIIASGRFAQGSGPVTQRKMLGEYADYLCGSFPSLAGIRVVLDAGNGAAGLVAPGIVGRLGADVVPLFCEPDGAFPNHHPDPVVTENLDHLIRAVRETGAHLGVAYDGDGDRVGVVDSDGCIVWGDRLLIIFARDILSRHPGAAIIGEVKCSQLMYDDIRSRGGEAIMGRTGHSLIKRLMKDTGALAAGEMSGHLFFADRYFGFDDAVYATLRLLEILKQQGEPYRITDLLAGLPEVWSTPEIRFDCGDDLKFRVVDRVREAFAGYDVNTTDGARINFGDGWALVRASNTQPALVLRFEAWSEAALTRIRAFVEEKLSVILRGITE